MRRFDWRQVADRLWPAYRRPFLLLVCCCALILSGLSLRPSEPDQPAKSNPRPEVGAAHSANRWLLFGEAYSSTRANQASGLSSNSYSNNSHRTNPERQEEPTEEIGVGAEEATSVLVAPARRSLSFNEETGDSVEPVWPAEGSRSILDASEPRRGQESGARWLPPAQTSGAGSLSKRFKRRTDSMRFVLMCQVLDGEPPIQIKWFKDDQELTGSEPSGRFEPGEQVELIANEELGGASLLFRRAQRQHSGNYTCLATNHFGTSSYSSVMSVRVPPSWKVEPQDQESIMGAQISIDCQAIGNPNPFIRWKFAQSLPQMQHLAASQSQLQAQGSDLNGEQQQQPLVPAAGGGQNFKLITSNHQVQTLENGSLAFRQLHKEHEGLYLCEADNGVEPNLIKVVRLQVRLQAQFLDELQVLGEPVGQDKKLAGVAAATATSTIGTNQNTGANQPARWVRVSQNASQLRLLCQPFGELPLTLDWLKDGQIIYTHSTGDLASLSAGSQHQAGTSSAVSFNQLEMAGRLHVNTRRGSAASSRAAGASQHWLANHQLDSELVLTNLRRQDGGLYGCQARNAYGQAERQIRLLVQEPPEPPEVVDVAHIGSRSIGLRWLAPFDGNSPIVKYLVEYRRQPASGSDASGEPTEASSGYGQSEKLMSVTKLDPAAGKQLYEPLLTAPDQPPQQVQHTVHELDPLTRYSMRVLAVNAIGRSRPSVALSLRTEEEVPSSLPTLVEATVLSSKSIKLHWTISYSPEREIIEGFFVGYRSFETGAPPSVDGSQTGAPSISLPGANPKHSPTLGEQPTFTYKTIRLTSRPGALTSQEAGSEARQQQLSETGGAALLSPVASITKTIHPAGSPFSGGPQTALHRQQHPQLAGSASPLNVVVSSFEYVIGSLERNTEYTILIQCFNKKGAGPTSDPVVFRTFMNDPPEKLALNADEVSESSIRVSWKFIGSNYIEHSGPQATSVMKMADPVDGYVLTFAKMRRHHSARPADPLSMAQNKPELGGNHEADSVPGGELEQVNRSASAAARISQANPTGAGFNGKPSEHWQTVQLAPQQRSHQLKNLECGTSYAMKIWAFNKIGKGEASDLITVSTRGKAPVAPDRRSFIATNSSQVRLHLSAWYDGGCEIEKFIVQYRARGQLEWILISNNILKEQASLLIRDLVPATSYELLVTAQNQVGPTEVKYRFTTLDADGKQVSNGLSIFGNQLSSNEGGLGEPDYADETANSREMWPSRSDHGSSSAGSNLMRLVFFFRQILNSPLALLCSLSLFILLLILFLVHRRSPSGHSSSSSTANTLTSSSAATNKSSSSASCNGRRLSTEATILGDMEGPLSIANGSLNDSPARLALQQVGAFQPPSVGTNHYQSFCAAAGQQQHQSGIADYGPSSMTTTQADCMASPYIHPSYGSAHQSTAHSMAAVANHYSLAGQSGPYASVQRSATMEPQHMATSGPLLNEHQQSATDQQQCLMQMLMMGPRAQQSGEQPLSSFVTSLARNKSHLSANSHNNYLAYSSNQRTATLGRPTSDYQRPHNN